MFQVDLICCIHSYPWPDTVGHRMDGPEWLEPTLMTILCCHCYKDSASESSRVRRSRVRASSQTF